MSRAASLALILALTLLAAFPAAAEADKDPSPVLAVMGRATLGAGPGQGGHIGGGLQQRRRHGGRAQVKAVKARLGAEGKLQSVGYRISQRFEWGGRRNRPAGYTASNQVKVTLKDVSLARLLLDDATQAGANIIKIRPHLGP